MDGLKKLLLASVATPLAITAFSTSYAASLPPGATEAGKLLLAQAIVEDIEEDETDAEDAEEAAPVEEDAAPADDEENSGAAEDGEAQSGETSEDDGQQGAASEAEPDAEPEPEAEAEAEPATTGQDDAEAPPSERAADPVPSVDGESDSTAEEFEAEEADPAAPDDRESLRERLQQEAQEAPEEPDGEREAESDAPDGGAELDAETDAESDAETDLDVAPDLEAGTDAEEGAPDAGGDAQTDGAGEAPPATVDEPSQEAGEAVEPEDDGAESIGERLRNLLGGGDDAEEEAPPETDASDEAQDTPSPGAEQPDAAGAEDGTSLRDRLRQRRQQERQSEEQAGEAPAAPSLDEGADEGERLDDGARDRDGPRERMRERTGQDDDRDGRERRAGERDGERDGIDRIRERSAEEREDRREEFQERVRDRRERGERRSDHRDRGDEADALDRIEEVREELRDEVRQLRRQREDQFEALRDEARRGGDRVIERAGDRVIIRNENNNFYIRHDDTSRFIRGAEDIETRRLRGGYTETIIRRPRGVTIVTVRDRAGAIVTRTRVTRDGREIMLIDNRPRRDRREPQFRVDYYSEILPPLRIDIPREQYIVETRRASPGQIRQALTAPPVVEIEESYALGEVLHNERLRDMVPRVDLDTITFEFDSAEIPDAEIETLEEIGYALEEILAENPDEIYLVEGHTDAPGSNTYNLALSDRRAENVAVILSEFFDVPPENLVTQGYGEEYLKIPTEARERENRRVTIRRITPLMAQAQ